MRRFAALLVVALVASAPAHTSAQATSRPAAPAPVTIMVGGLMLHLGMARDETLQRLGAAFDVTPVKGQSATYVLRGKQPPATIVASIAFADGRLAHVSRQWTVTDYAAGVVEALRALNGSPSCSIAETTAGDAPMMRVVCGQRTVEVSGGGAAASAATVSETVRSR